MSHMLLTSPYSCGAGRRAKPIPADPRDPLAFIIPVRASRMKPLPRRAVGFARCATCQPARPERRARPHPCRVPRFPNRPTHKKRAATFVRGGAFLLAISHDDVPAVDARYICGPRPTVTYFPTIAYSNRIISVCECRPNPGMLAAGGRVLEGWLLGVK